MNGKSNVKCVLVCICARIHFDVLHCCIARLTLQCCFWRLTLQWCTAHWVLQNWSEWLTLQQFCAAGLPLQGWSAGLILMCYYAVDLAVVWSSRFLWQFVVAERRWPGTCWTGPGSATACAGSPHPLWCSWVQSVWPEASLPQDRRGWKPRLPAWPGRWPVIITIQSRLDLWFQFNNDAACLKMEYEIHFEQYCTRSK